MTREMQALVKRAKEQAAVLVRYANPRSKSKPTLEQVKNILARHIPYCNGVVPAIVSCEVSEFHHNENGNYYAERERQTALEAWARAQHSNCICWSVCVVEG